MPKQQLPKKKDFDHLKFKLQKWGFCQISEEKTFPEKNKRLISPRLRKGKESGFLFKANNLMVIVWTTWLEKEERARDSDAGWVLIVDQNKALYFSHPIHRTKNFIVNLLRESYVARQRIINRPICPICGSFMNIKKGKGIKARYWACPNIFIHQDKRNSIKDWDCGIKNPKIRKYLEKKRKKRKKYREKIRKQGKEVKPAIMTRKPWKVLN